MTLGAGLVLAGIAAAPTASAQDAAFPFPSSNISSGQITSVLTSHELRADYNRWREQLIERCPQGDARMKYPESGNDTRSEGVGYGMVISAYMGDKATFDGLWNYYQRTSAGTGLMNWRRTDCAGGGGGGDTGSASDADVDAALGLIVANRQWPGQGYNTDAAALVADIRSALFLPGCPALLTAGSQFAACGCINPSYLPPGYYPAFAANDAGQAQFWTNAVNGTYTYFNAIRTTNGNTNLVPAWSSSNGSLTLACSSPPQVSGGGATNQFQADAARTPWRVATDFQWTGSANADAFLQRIVTFAKTQRVAQIVSLYSLAGQPLNGNGQGATLDAEGTRSSFTMGGLASAMTAGTQEDLDAFTGAWQSLYRDGDEFGDTGGQQYRAFNNSLALLYGLTVTGNMWNPMGPNPTPNTDPPLATQQGNLLVNGDFDEGLLGWKFQNIQGDGTVLRGEGYAMHLDGEMHLVVTRAANPDTLNYQVRLQQTATVQNGQNYLISVRARSDAERPFSVGIENAAGGGNIANLGNRRADAPLTLTTEMRTYDWVFTSTASGTMNVNIDVASSDVDLVLDDVVLAPTDLAPTTTGDLAGVEPDPGTGTPDPGTPGTGTPGTGTPGGTPTGTPGDGTIGTVDPTGDTPGSTGSTPGATPGAPNPDDSVAGLPPAPTTAPGAASCSAQNPNVCAPALCSVPLGLCYDANTGYVWSPMQNTYTQPPRGVQGCAADQVYWPKFGLCYIPETGWIYNPVATANAPAGWQFYGIDYTQNKKPPAEDSGCSVASAPGSDAGSKWMFAGLLGAALGLTMRRRKA
ncbi:MAG TPA: glycosyl hydrolase family 8 [Polyangiaceae bacterium]|nr:glycosyl hydrolase family 8 [Polyangiaceae bacterium]